MGTKVEFIANKKEFKRLSRLVEPYCNWDITACKDKKVYYADWNEYHRKKSFRFLYDLIKKSSDKEIFFFALMEGEYARSYIKDTGTYPILKVQTPFTEDEFYKALYMEPMEKIPGRTYALGYDCTYILFPDTLNWYIYGEYDIELSKLVTNLELPERENNIPYFYSEEDAKKQMSFL